MLRRGGRVATFLIDGWMKLGGFVYCVCSVCLKTGKSSGVWKYIYGDCVVVPRRRVIVFDANGNQIASTNVDGRSR